MDTVRTAIFWGIQAVTRLPEILRRSKLLIRLGLTGTDAAFERRFGPYRKDTTTWEVY